MTMDKITAMKAEEKRFSAIAWIFMIENTIYILLDHKNEYFVKNKNSLSHQIYTKLYKQLKTTWKKIGKPTQYQRRLYQNVYRKEKLR
jgi:hypothetical protein